MAGPLDEAYVEITAELDTRQVQRAAQTAGRIVENELTNGVRNAEGSMAREGGRIADAAGQSIGDTLADSIGESLGEGLRRDVNGRLRDEFGRFVNDSSRGGRNTGSAFGSGFSDGLSSTLSSIVGIRLPTPAFAVLGGAMAAAAASAVQLASALAPAVGIVAALPSGIGVLAAGMTTLSVATMGVGEAFEAAATGSAEEFEEAMEGLAPSVQEAAQAIRDMMPQLEELRNSVQGAFFQDFDDVLNSLADTLLGPVTTGMTAVATEINSLIVGLTGVATSAEGIDFVTQSFEIMAGILAQLQDPLIVLFSSILNVGTAINEAFGENAGAGLADMIMRFAQFLDQAAASGAAVQWINDALAVFQAIGDILSPIVGIFLSIGEAASATGGNILGVFGQVLQVFDDFLASAQGQDILITIFESLNTVGDAFATVLSNIAPALPPIISGISAILGAVAPLLGPLSQLVGSVLGALAPILNIVAAAITPLIPPLTSILELLGPLLTDAISTLMPVIELLAGLLADQLGIAIEVVGTILEALAPIITVVLDALSPLIEALQPLFEVLGLIADLVGAVLGPIIQVLGDILLWLVENVIVPFVIPIIEDLIQVLTVVLGAAIEWVVEQFQLAGEGMRIIWEFIKNTITKRVEEITQGWDALVALFKIGWQILNNQVFTPIKNGINTVKTVVSSALDGIESGWNSFVGFIKGIPGKISGALGSLFDPLADGFRSAINSVIDGWNNLSFSVPSVDLGALGSVGGFTVSTPNIPRLQVGGMSMGEGLAYLDPNEAILPLEDSRTETLLAGALRAALGGAGVGGAQTMAAPNMSVTVRIGERELDAMIDTRIDSNNQQMLRRARSGTRRNH